MNSSAGDDGDGIRIKVKVIPRAKMNQISGLMEDGSLKVRLSAPPVDGKANRALISLLADALDIPKADIAITSGTHSRQKTVKVIGLNSKEYQEIIDQLV